MVLRHVGHRRLGEERVLRQREHHRAGPAGHGGVEGVAHVLRNALHAIDLRHPLRHLTVHAPVVDLLERLALGKLVRHLADEHHHRCRILETRVHADGAVARARTARYEKHARLAGELAVGLGHVGSAAFLPADDELDLLTQIMQSVEHGQIALAGHAESETHALRRERIGKDAAAVTRLQIGFHAGTFSNARRSAAQQSATAVLAVSSTPPKSTKPCTMSAYSR